MLFLMKDAERFYFKHLENHVEFRRNAISILTMPTWF